MSPADTNRRGTRATTHNTVLLLVVGLALTGTAGLAGLQQPTAREPVAITAADVHHTVIGLIYSPAVLTDLLAQQTEKQPSPIIAAAAERNTPVVAMWTPPVPAEVGPPLLPYQWKIVVLPSGNLFGTDKIEPLWIEHDLGAVVPVASSLHQPFIGAVAAFSPGVLSKGRRICLYAEYPPDYEAKKAGLVTRCADL